MFDIIKIKALWGEFMDLQRKLEILSDAAKYDVSCSSSGSNRSSKKGDLGSTATSGICHSFTPDGRCISLFKVLLTNYCIYDCSYCLNRKSNPVDRAAFTVDEVVSLTINFYRRNYIEGLFLSSGIIKSPDHTMEMLMRIVKKLRLEFGFRGYIHLKAIPGASQELIHEAGLYADRMSVNIELPSAQSLKLLAPDKEKTDIFSPMKLIKSNILEAKDTKKHFKHAPLFVPGGQSTQMIIGASPENDLNILTLSERLYQKYLLKRVYYSAYIPINTTDHLPSIASPPTLREHRLYQSDWLLRLYGFKATELLDDQTPNLDINFDPKTSWALRNLHLFPLEVNTAPYEMLIRVPGIGLKGAQKIIAARKLCSLTFEDLVKLRITLKRAQYFILCRGKYNGQVAYDEPLITQALSPKVDLNIIEQSFSQLSLFDQHISPIPNKLLLLNDTHTSITGEL
ncbi:MAG: putative DNA modification/repair radical SAM protein [Cellulosilyticaceae bacterium]